MQSDIPRINANDIKSHKFLNIYSGNITQLSLEFINKFLISSSVSELLSLEEIEVFSESFVLFFLFIFLFSFFLRVFFLTILVFNYIVLVFPSFGLTENLSCLSDSSVSSIDYVSESSFELCLSLDFLVKSLSSSSSFAISLAFIVDILGQVRLPNFFYYFGLGEFDSNGLGVYSLTFKLYSLFIFLQSFIIFLKSLTFLCLSSKEMPLSKNYE